ncbi:uncharacterized protein ATNIH1004_009653 [Aspergillus tanneri]|uniref:DUF4048 domain-containing protein n=1 Tax=Aspergillus tanneri TaxID=1220188 RepID=A0A5M9M783_9EURO|nr:uncharacterized protein ATNIH1004_009653 [Aspergillus tanneri]KAA8642892.1 hypothetical protein ATNIH1004_009653 [Aspergillus tanneri]
MGDFPGTVQAGAAPEASQPSFLDFDQSDDQQSQQSQPKRSSLPPRPHGAARHTKRLTLNFPINIPPTPTPFDPSASTPGSMTPLTRSATFQSPAALPVGTPVQFDDQDDGSSILTAIASQERRVLELREELHRAEVELDSLKKQWAQSEKTKKRTEISQHAEPLIPLRSPDRGVADESARHQRDSSVGSSESPSIAHPRLSREVGRRQSMRAAAAKGMSVSANGRRVFQGSHTRALSLLSPVSGLSSTQQESEESVGRVGRSPRSATLPSSVERSPMAVENVERAEDAPPQWRKSMPPPSREALMRTGKQMASDLKEGLWTFLEDIRQATVGEEGISATESRAMPPPRKRDSSSTSRSRDRLSVQGSKPSRSPSSSSVSARNNERGVKTSGKDSKSADIGSSFWSEFGIDVPGQKSPNARGASANPSGLNEPESNNFDIDDNWDNDWDTPQPKKMHTPSSSRSTLESKHDQSPMTQASSPRTSASVSDGIPWPAIAKMAPSKLARTASNLMAEWEHSLSPSPERNDKTSLPLDKDDKEN